MSSTVKLTEIRKEDSDILFKWINNPKLVILNSNYHPVNFKSHEEWMEMIVKNKDVSIFAIRTTVNDELIGTCQLHSLNHINRTGELQIRIGNIEHQSKGLGTQAVKLLLEYGFNSLNLKKIYLHVLEDNERAIKSYLKCGFIVEGCLKRHVFIDGAYKNLVLMAVFNS